MSRTTQKIILYIYIFLKMLESFKVLKIKGFELENSKALKFTVKFSVVSGNYLVTFAYNENNDTILLFFLCDSFFKAKIS